MRLGSVRAPGYMTSWLVFGDVDHAQWLDLHRMSQATARAAFVERIHYLLQQLPTAEVEAYHALTDSIGYDRLQSNTISQRARPLSHPDTPTPMSTANTSSDAVHPADGFVTACKGGTVNNVHGVEQSNINTIHESTVQSANYAGAQQANVRGSTGPLDLVVVVGQGRHSNGLGGSMERMDRTPLKVAILEVCETLQLECIEDVDNPGRLVVTHEALVALAARSASRSEVVLMMRRIQSRIAALLVLGFGTTALMSMSFWSNTLQSVF